MRIGLALGGGGAKGLAHIPVLETLDALGAQPAVIAGTSIGAVIGALYASGQSGEQLREGLEEHLFEEKAGGKSFDLAKGFRTLMELVDFDLRSGGIVGGRKMVEFLCEDVKANTFEELHVPLKVVATDFWSREQVVFDSGDLMPAVRASMSLPVLFAPVVLDGRVLMDGGAVNPVPWDLLVDECDLSIAVDVGGSRIRRDEDPVPGLGESIFNTFQIMSKAIVDEKLRRRPPDVYLRPDIVDVQMLEFDRAQEIYARAVPSCIELRERLEPLLASA